MALEHPLLLAAREAHQVIAANGTADRHHRRQLLGRRTLLLLANGPQLSSNLGDQTTDICRGDRGAELGIMLSFPPST
jgi:hypothetical protein